MLYSNLKINEKGNLEIGNSDTVFLAEKYGTPLYIYDEDKVRDNMRKYSSSLAKYYGKNSLVLYASKAFCCKYMHSLCMQENLGVDVVSGGELYTALRSGVLSSRIYFHGNNKTSEELMLAVTNNVGRIVVDNIYELVLLDGIAKQKNKTVDILIRIKPGVDAHTHDFIKTGCIDSKFGVALENGEAVAIVNYIRKLKNVKLVGLHCHIGSQIFESEPFCVAAMRLLEFAYAMKEKTGIEIKELNLGGGIGIKYTESDDPLCIEEYVKKISETVNSFCEKTGFNKPMLILEPGRSIVGNAGITLYRVGAVKEIAGIRTYISVDGGMSDNPRYALYNAKYEAENAGKVSNKKDKVYTLAGKCCESGDIIQENIKLQQTEAGDILAVLGTGAYNYSMASNYNRIPRPAVVFVTGGKDRLVVKREKYEDLISKDV